MELLRGKLCLNLTGAVTSLVFEAATSERSSSPHGNTQAGLAYAKIHHGLLQKMKVDANSWRENMKERTPHLIHTFSILFC